MNREIRNNKDFWAGVMFFIVGAIAVGASRNYPFGETMRMGPGYFPTLLGIIMMGFGVIIMIQGLRKFVRIERNWSNRPLIILPLALVIFGSLMEIAGFIPALVALIFISAASGREFKFIEILILTAILVSMSWLIFIWGLELPYPVFLKPW